MTSQPTTSSRILSMDQFRGYTVLGMFVVNFLAGFTVIHHVFKHNNTHFSYADSIMPSFMFAAGFAYRLTMLRRLPQYGWGRSFLRVLVRSSILILIAFALYLGELASFDKRGFGYITQPEFLPVLLKANLWNVLAIIGVAQLLIFPVVATRPWIRVLAMITLMATHVVLSYYFNYNFINGLPNCLDTYWGIEKSTAWDGGFFGPIMWAVPMLAGTLAYDIVVAGNKGARSVLWLVGLGCALMLVAYLISCLTRLYDVDTPERQEPHAASPVALPIHKIGLGSFTSLLAEPPFVPPPPTSQRQLNFWMMNKRIVSISFMLFSTGFAMTLYGLFVLVCDTWRPIAADSGTNQYPLSFGLGWGLLLVGATGFFLSVIGLTNEALGPRLLESEGWLADHVNHRITWFTLNDWIFAILATSFATMVGWDLRNRVVGLPTDIGWLFGVLGRNPLAAYIIHEVLLAVPALLIEQGILSKDAALWLCLYCLVVFLFLAILPVSLMDRRKIYLRL